MNNFIKRYIVLGDEQAAILELAPKADGAGAVFDAPGKAAESDGGLKSLGRTAKDGAEAEAISKALDETNWNRKQAAATSEDQLQGSAL